MKIGVQLFGCMKMYNADPEGLLQKLETAGFTQAEPCIFFGEIPQGMPPFAWPSSELSTHMARLQAHHLTVTSCHAFGDLEANLPELLDAAARYGITAYVIGYHGALEQEALSQFAASCIRLSDALSAAGVQLWLHNGSADIVSRQIEGIPAALWLLQKCGGKLGMQVDTGWVVCGGIDLRQFMEDAAPYIRSIHHKDLLALPKEGETFTNVAIGEGIVDSAFAREFAVWHALPQLVDQDNSAGDMLAELARSADFIRA